MSATTNPTGAQTHPASAPRTGRAPGWWRHVGLQTAVFAVLVLFDLGAIRDTEALGAHLLRAAGTAVVFAGLLVQRSRSEPGLAVVAGGLGMLAVNPLGSLFLGFAVVVYEAWFIAAVLVRRRRWWLAALCLGTVLTEVVMFWRIRAEFPREAGWIVPSVSIAFSLISIALAIQVGVNSRRRRQEVADLAARAELAALTERTRIAREMHDIVAHSLTAVIAQADGGRYAGRRDPDKALTALDTIAATGRGALGQMRALLSVLREEDPRSADAVPGIDNIDGLVAAAERDGLSIEFLETGERGTVSEAFGLAVYRIVQECLTNVLKHAGRTQARIRLCWQPQQLAVEIDNAPGAALVATGAGRGLAGVRERARLLGGDAHWGESTVFVGGFGVRAVLRR